MPAKPVFGTEFYIKTIQNRKLRSILCKLRCGTLPIQIELGRYSKTPRAERICRYCTKGEVEDENHILFHCPLYHDERKKFFDSRKFDTNVTFSDLMSNDVIVDTAYFLSDLLSIRARTV